MILVDTNILLYAADSSVAEHSKALAAVERLRCGKAPWALTWNVLYEFLRVATHPRVKVRPWSLAEAGAFVDALLASPTLTLLMPTDRHAQILATAMVEVPSLAGSKVFDLQTAVLMREHGVRRIYTNDMDFHRFPWVHVINPLV